MLNVHARYLRKLARENRLSAGRATGCPGTRRSPRAGPRASGSPRPELSVLLAHTKIAADQDVLASDLPDDPYLHDPLPSYFPAPLRTASPTG